MKKHIISFFKLPWYFAAFAAYPALALLRTNISEVRYTAGIRPAVVSIFGATVLFLLCRMVYRNWHRAGFASAGLVLLFFSYGHVSDLISKRWQVPHLETWMLGTWLILALLVLFWAGQRKATLERAAAVLNILSLGLVLVALTQVAWLSIPLEANAPVADHAPLQALDTPAGRTLPDIYYIILDSYGRSDLLQRNFGYDNSEFLAHLQQMGFYVAECSQSNYNRTDSSMSSSLNMQYLQNLDDDFRPENINRGSLWASIKQSAVRYELESAGYKIIAFATGYAWSEITDVDEYLAPSLVWSELTDFETFLLRTTPARHFEDLGWINLDQIDGQRIRERTRLIFNSMEALAHMPGPKFTFIHILPPHPLFVFAPDGSPTDPAEFLGEDRLYDFEAYKRGYLNQVAYINDQMENALSTLISESTAPPVIILQGDHGPWLQSGADKFKVLNAYFLPEQTGLLYPTISPVNSFRLVLNAYLGADYPLLNDISYNSPTPHVFDFTEVGNLCVPKPGP
jgi:hypothetical protein